jgi:thiol-disulfide isomerase/thioredoxin
VSRPRRRAALAAALALALGEAAVAATAPGAELLGRPAPELTVSHWTNSDPLTLAGLRGKVVLVRWWTAPGCPFCAATAPSLNALHDRYAERGLVVIGLYHHKAAEPLDPDRVARLADAFGFRFPLAIDDGWETLRRWWLDGGERRWTSVSFLLDRDGVVRWVHPGGEYPPGSEDHAELVAAVEALLGDG